ncbi:MAG: hypothetical protein LC790_11410 [Actinobacteria bacterium]|nr:hypothetical protein [Actinomycetota bacterium]
MTVRSTIAAITTASLLAGCGLADPNATRTPASATPAATGPPAVPGQQRDPLVRVAVDYTLTQATWSPDRYLAQKARLARLSTGRARAQLTVRDGQSPVDIVAHMRAARSSSSATLIGTDGPSRDRVVVVAHKVLATGTGHTGGPNYQIAHVTLTRQHGAWRVIDFAIQP